MKTSRVFAFWSIALSATLLVGCSSQAHFSQSELDQIKNHQSTPMPEAARAAMAQNMKNGQALYQQRLKEAGLLGPNGMRKGEGPPGGPPSNAGPGTIQ